MEKQAPKTGEEIGEETEKEAETETKTETETETETEAKTETKTETEAEAKTETETEPDEEAEEETGKETVLMVHNFYQIGGGEHTVFENEQRLLREHGHRLVSYTRNNDELRHSFLKKLLMPFTTIFSLKTFLEVRRILRKENITLVHCQNTFPLISPAVYYAAWSCHVPVVQTIHNFRFLCPNGVFFRDGHACEDCVKRGLGCAVRNGCYRSSRLQSLVVAAMLTVHRRLGTYQRLRYIFLTEFNREKFRPLLGDKIESEFIKPNFEYVDRPEGIPEREDYYVFLGRLDQNKGVDFLLNAWKGDKRLYIIGGGELEETAREASRKNRSLRCLGFLPHDRIWHYLARAQAVIFSSDLYEGFPLTIIEAFAFGTPVICTDIGNGADMVRTSDAGVCYTPRDAESLYHAMEQLRKNYAYYSGNARRAYEQAYTPEANYRMLKAIYEAVTEENEE